MDVNDKKLKEKKKVLFIVEAMGGGVFTYIVDLANELVNSYDMYIAYAVRTQTPVNYREYFDKRIHLIKVINFTRSIHLVKDGKAFFEIKQIVKEVRPDIIHLHSSKAGVLGRWAFNGHKIPLFYTPHGYSFLMSNYSWIKRNVFRMIEGITAKRYCTIISCSKGEHQETLRLTKNATYVNNGIYVNGLKKLLKEVNSDSALSPNEQIRFRVFTLGRICHQKNPELFNYIAKAMPDVKFLWIGDGELREKLSAHNIEITGWVDRKEALKYCLSADVFLLTSLWEGLPISLLEAMYMKKVCIVSDVIGNHDVIRDGENGYVCREIKEFIKAIKTVQTTSQTELINHAYSDILNKYNITVMAKGYSRIYQKFLNRRFLDKSNQE